ncbi:hypothetical protein VN97_g12496, partial [Penicillium thymicola]
MEWYLTTSKRLVTQEP